MSFLEDIQRERDEYAETLARFEGGTAFVHTGHTDVTQQEIELERRIIAELDALIAIELANA